MIKPANKQPAKQTASKGFTIVELLVVIVVIAILVLVAIVAYNGIQNRAASSGLKSDLRTAANKIGIQQVETGSYPTSLPSDVKNSANTNFQYTSNGTSYCITATSTREGVEAQHISSAGGAGQGACSGHSSSGPVVLTCPSGFIVVPGSNVFGTSDFCVMKYEAKNGGSNTPVSTEAGTPWVSISQTNAIAYSQNACADCHLITEAEWMTLAANVLSVPSNWSGGSIGSGVIYSGHNDNNPANALAATTDDNDGYNGTGNTSGSNQRRTLTLTNGEVIWDLAGNVNEWTSGTISGNQPGLSTDNVDGASFALKQWNNSSMNWNNLPASSRPSAIAAVPGLSNINSWTSTHGIGQLYSNQNQTSVRAFHRGGSWASGSYAGVLTLFLNGAPGHAATGLGFRVAR